MKISVPAACTAAYEPRRRRGKEKLALAFSLLFTLCAILCIYCATLCYTLGIPTVLPYAPFPKCPFSSPIYFSQLFGVYSVYTLYSRVILPSVSSSSLYVYTILEGGIRQPRRLRDKYLYYLFVLTSECILTSDEKFEMFEGEGGRLAVSIYAPYIGHDSGHLMSCGLNICK